jgi:uncharacterized protein YndB with AHSA1/START domain
VTRVEVEERVGGHYRVWHAAGDNAVGGFDGEILELVPDERVAFRWGFVGPQWRDGPSFDSALTITLRESPDGGTVLTVVHERLAELATAMPEVAANVESGWLQVLEQLTTTLSTMEVGHA